MEKRKEVVMRENLQVQLGADRGVPFVDVPLGEMWELVEYLSWHRVLANYDYAETHFRVSFPHLDLGAAQSLIAQWEQVKAHPVQVFGQEHPAHQKHHVLALH